MRLGTFISAAALLLLLSAPALAQKPGKPADETKKPASKETAQEKESGKPAENAKSEKAKPAPGITRAREAAVMAFVTHHHPELADLLVQLKSGNTKEYEKAVRELFRTSERLAQIREKDMVQYDLELTLWQAQSRVQLLSARVKMSTSKDLREQLKTALNDQLDARIALLKREREKASERIADLDQQLQRMEKNRKQLVDRQAETLAGGEKPAPKDKPASRQTPSGTPAGS
jgi:hypothetical protein